MKCPKCGSKEIARMPDIEESNPDSWLTCKICLLSWIPDTYGVSSYWKVRGKRRYGRWIMVPQGTLPVFEESE